MDLINNTQKVDSKEEKIKKVIKTTIIVLILLFIVTLLLTIYVYSEQKKQLKVNVDGIDKAETMSQLFVLENDKIYVPIKRFAKAFGYETYDGEYKQNYLEDKTKCYIKDKNEVASYILGSNQIYKKMIGENSNNSDYEYFELDEPVREINGELYTTVQGISRGCNIALNYYKDNNQIDIYTLAKLVSSYSASYQKSQINVETENFSNQKAILYNMLIVSNQDKEYGVNNLKGETIIGIKYSNIKFVESSKTFIVKTSNNKVGIISSDATPIIAPEFDEIKQITNELYLVAIDKKQGIINKKGETIIYPEYDAIGVDGSKYTNIENKYVILNNYIPVMQEKKWGLYDITGKQILPIEYDEIGCTEKTKTIANYVVAIPKYELIVAKKNKLYGIVDKTRKNSNTFFIKQCIFCYKFRNRKILYDI